MSVRFRLRRQNSQKAVNGPLCSFILFLWSAQMEIVKW